jgi:hypothetical protein
VTGEEGQSRHPELARLLGGTLPRMLKGAVVLDPVLDGFVVAPGDFNHAGY